MSEREGDGGKTAAFLLGFVLGVLVSLGAGVGFYLYQARNHAAMAEMARMEAERAMVAERAAREEAMRAMDLLEKLKAREKEKK